MKRDGQNDKSGNGWPSTIELNDGPYISSSAKADVREEDRSLDDLSPADHPAGTYRRRKVLLIGILVLGGVCALLAYNAFYRDRHRIDYKILEKRNEAPESRMSTGTGVEVERTDQITVDAINQVKEELRKTAAAAVNAPLQPQGKAQISESQPAGETLTPLPILDHSAQTISSAVPRPAENGGKPDDVSARPTSIGNDQGGRNSQPASRSNGQASSHSIYATEAEKSKAITASPRSKIESGSASTEIRRSVIENPKVHLPDFGAMLPVRTLGKVYTLRSSSLVRLEATRDVAGEGWTIKRGTILVADLQGGEVDRAFVTVKGFIDPDTNRFVKLSGDVLGNDGAPGLKGKRRQVSSRWGRAFSRVSAGALLLGQAALSRGSATVILPGSSGISGIGSDFGMSNSTLTRREFVEIPANSTAYILVTGLPKEAQGMDAEPAAQPTETLTDDELAELLSSGTPEQIGDALPRMSAEMRKLALLVLGDKSK